MMKVKYNKETNSLIEKVEELRKWIDKQEHEEFLIEVKKFYQKRSENQNRYYWDIIIGEGCKYTGYDKDEMHECFKQTFIDNCDDNFKLRRCKSTKDMATIEFADYMERIRRFAATEWGVYMPNPNEYN